ncbi:MAG: alpha-amylase family glycosyl hydrolase [Verrucomicrobiales bacterium]
MMDSSEERVRVYQLLLRHFGNEKAAGLLGGTLAENGCGKFSALNTRSLGEIRALGFTHVWLTGVQEQASGTAYPGRPADPPDILKGMAGSPYAIRDYFDVCPDYAEDPERRLEEFRDCLARCRAAGLRVIIDFVPNHVARSYGSGVRPELSFGAGDDPGRFFHRDNNFYYLGARHEGGGAPLKLPTQGLPGCTGFFEPEREVGRVTGNNAVTWAPGLHDWYETVKLNYGVDFTKGRDVAHLPGEEADPAEVPDTWRKMDAVLAYWQEMGVGGFRADMAHMVPMAFWRWALRRVRAREAGCFLMAEAYDTDPMKMTDGDVFEELLEAGFDAVYDDQSYDVLKGIYEGDKWANDLDGAARRGSRLHHALRYAENHDEVRLANSQHWRGIGMAVGRPVTAALLGLGRGAVMLYSGQEVGEPAEGAEGFSGDDGRSSIFDYGVLPELQKWTNGGRFDGGGLSADQRELRAWYGRLFRLLGEPAFARGGYYGLNYANRENYAFGRCGTENWSGHWCLAYLRSERRADGQQVLVVVNLHPHETMRFLRIDVPQHAREWARLPAESRWRDRLGDGGESVLADGALELSDLPPCSARYYEVISESERG